MEPVIFLLICIWGPGPLELGNKPVHDVNWEKMGKAIILLVWISSNRITWNQHNQLNGLSVWWMTYMHKFKKQAGHWTN